MTNSPARPARLAVVALVAVLLSACSPSTYSVLPSAPGVSEDVAQVQAGRLVLLVEQLELRYAVGASAGPDVLLPPGVAVTNAAERLSEHLFLSSQSRAYVTAHAAHLDEEWDSRERPTDVSVVASDVHVAGRTGSADPVAGVTLEVTYEFAEDADRVVSGRYAITWTETDTPGADAHGNPTTGEHFDGVRMLEVYPLYEEDGRPALDSGNGSRSPSGVIGEYVRAVANDRPSAIDRLEGDIHTSQEVRDGLRATLRRVPRYTLVEIPGARAGDQHVLYVVQDGGVGVQGFEVTVGSGQPVVTPRL